MEPRTVLPAGSGAGSLADAPPDAAALRRRLAAAGSGPARVRGDHDLNPDLHPAVSPTRAAVLVPIVLHEDGLTVILTLRTPHLSAHAGQISFPGGRVDPGDADDAAAALRETEEEIGLAPDRVELAGRLDTYVTRTGFRIAPFVGLVRPPLDLRPDPFEVAETFEVPLAFLLGPGNPQRHSRRFEERERYFYAFPYGERYIWGATAGMLVNLRDVLAGDVPASNVPASDVPASDVAASSGGGPA